jgi:hypothetical protein
MKVDITNSSYGIQEDNKNFEVLFVHIIKVKTLNL